MPLAVKSPVAVTIGRRALDLPFTRLAVQDTPERPSNSVDFLYLDYADDPASQSLDLAEAYRLLAPQGLVRICAINLDEVVHAYLFNWITGDGSGQTRAQRLDRWLSGRSGLRNEEDMTAVLESAGFVEVRRFLPGAGSHPLFWDREQEHEHRLVLEARKPAAE